MSSNLATGPFSSYSDAKSRTPIRTSSRSLNGLGNSRTAFVRSMPSWKTVHGREASLPRPWFQTEMTVLPPSE